MTGEGLVMALVSFSLGYLLCLVLCAHLPLDHRQRDEMLHEVFGDYRTHNRIALPSRMPNRRPDDLVHGQTVEPTEERG
jgi:hypothetical protein